jgi:Spx/MgsR family transcriptional regulator
LLSSGSSQTPIPEQQQVITLYGIRSCDTVRKARRWLEQHGIDYHYHDLREDGLDAAQVNDWLAQVGSEVLINRRSTTWKGLSAEARETLQTGNATDLALEHPTLIKRPLLDTGSELHVGFAPARYQDIFDRHTL